MPVEADSVAAAAPGTLAQRIVAFALQFWPDLYGERSFFGPRYRSKTSIGGCISLCCFLLISVLFVYTWIEFFGSTSYLSTLGNLHANSLMEIGDRRNLTALRNAILPTLSMLISASSRTSSQAVITTTITQFPTMRVTQANAPPEFSSVTRHPSALSLTAS
jgi:hypothetical protein